MLSRLLKGKPMESNQSMESNTVNIESNAPFYKKNLDKINLMIKMRRQSVRMELIAAREMMHRGSELLPPSKSVYNLVKSYEEYSLNGNSTSDDYRLMRRAFSATLGKSNQMMSEVIEGIDNKTDVNFEESMFIKDNTAMPYVRHCTSELRKTGYVKLKFQLPAELVKNIKSSITGRMNDDTQGNADKIFSLDSEARPQIKTNMDWLLTQPYVYEISSDPVLFKIAQEYLGVDPILSTPVAMLNSVNGLKNDAELSKVAQLYHHDLDRLKFLKLFIYLTDVDGGSGPHAMIRGSHHARPDLLWQDGRHPDKLVYELGLKNRETVVHGKSGTMFIVDTSALHKGTHPEINPRLMLQLQYSNSMFGAPISSSNHKLEALTEKSSTQDVQAAELVMKYAEKRSVRFMQNFI